MDYCITYTGSESEGRADAVLLVNPPLYQCEDFLFSTHPQDMTSVWEEFPPDCSGTPGGRAAHLSFAESTTWYGSDAYTCLLLNDGA